MIGIERRRQRNVDDRPAMTFMDDVMNHSVEERLRRIMSSSFFERLVFFEALASFYRSKDDYYDGEYVDPSPVVERLSPRPIGAYELSRSERSALKKIVYQDIAKLNEDAFRRYLLDDAAHAMVVRRMLQRSMHAIGRGWSESLLKRIASGDTPIDLDSMRVIGVSEKDGIMAIGDSAILIDDVWDGYALKGKCTIEARITQHAEGWSGIMPKDAFERACGSPSERSHDRFFIVGVIEETFIDSMRLRKRGALKLGLVGWRRGTIDAVMSLRSRAAAGIERASILLADKGYEMGAYAIIHHGTPSWHALLAAANASDGKPVSVMILSDALKRALSAASSKFGADRAERFKADDHARHLNSIVDSNACYAALMVGDELVGAVEARIYPELFSGREPKLDLRSSCYDPAAYAYAACCYHDLCDSGAAERTITEMRRVGTEDGDGR